MNHETIKEDSGIVENNTESKIMFIRQQVFMMGANDTEHARFDELIKSWKSGEFTDEEAVAEAQKILDSKMDHH